MIVSIYPVAQLSLAKSRFDFVSIGMENWYEISICVNWLALIVLILIARIIVCVYRRLIGKQKHRTITLDGIEFGISNFKCQFKRTHDIQEIAYKLWIELTTRKIAIPVEENDVIVEVYNSWHDAFSSIRELMKAVPGSCLDDANDLIVVTNRVLNEGLRPHLTKWQARYRTWYKHEVELDANKDKTPQEIQKKFPEYEALIEDMRKTNKNMVNFAEKMKKIAFSEKNDA